jgi:3'(2'), 5'-bisphosphate nucleotidase
MMSDSLLPIDTLINELLSIAQHAATIILRHYQSDIQVDYKSDASPVTAADQESNDYIVDALSQLTPTIPIIAEESAEQAEIDRLETRFWLVDPLDGTKEFINKNGDFTINIALIEFGVPTIAILHVPVSAISYLALGPQRGAYRVDKQGQRSRIYAKQVNEDAPVMVVSRSHLSQETQNFINQYPHAQSQSRGSSLKFCLLAEGQADIYPRFGRTMEWDTAAGHAVLLSAGGSVDTMENSPLSYGKTGLDNPHFIAYGQRS